MAKKSLLMQYLRDTTKLRIMDFFLQNRSDYSKKEIIENVGISKTTFYKVWDELAGFGVVKPARKYGMAQLYALDESSAVVKKFIALDAELGRHAMKKSLGREAAAAH